MSVPKIQPVTPCGFVGKCYSTPASYKNDLEHSGFSFSRVSASPKRVAAYALSELEKAHAKDVAVHESNATALENNRLVRAAVETLMAEIGMPKSYRGPVAQARRSRFGTSKTAAFDAGYRALPGSRRFAPLVSRQTA